MFWRTDLKKSREQYKNIGLLIIFILLSFIALFPFFKSDAINSGIDLAFHLNRIVNLSETLRHGKLFSFISTWGLNGVGVPVNMAYGCLPLYPFAVLFMIVHNKIFAYYLGIMFWLVVSCVLSYLFSYKYYGQKIKSVAFSIIYTFANYLFGNFFIIGDIGQAVAWIFMPMFVYGCYSSFIKDDKHREWYYVPLSLAAIVYSHIITTLIAISILGVFLVIALVKRQDLMGKLIVCIKQFFFTLGMTLFYWINLASILKNKLSIPHCPQLSGIDVGSFIQQQFTWGGNRLGAIVTILFVVGLFNWKRMNKYSKGIAIMALLYSFLMTNISTVFLIVLSYTPFRMIQWTGRLAGAVNLFSIIFDIDVIAVLFKKKSFKKLGYIEVVGLILISFVGQGMSFVSTSNFKSINHVATLNKPLPFGNWKITSSKGVNYVAGKDYTGVGSLDYWPSRSLNFKNSIINNDVFVNGKIKDVSIKRGVDKFKLSGLALKRRVEVNTPFLYNHGYRILQNGKELSYWQSYRGTVSFDTKNSGEPIVIQYCVPQIAKVACIISVVVTIILTVIILKNKKLVAMRRPTLAE